MKIREIRIDHYFHDARADAKLEEILSRLTQIGATMAKADDVRALSQRLDAATNEIAKDLQALRDKIAEGTVSADDLAPLDATITRLEALGQDPENPVPEPSPA